MKQMYLKWCDDELKWIDYTPPKTYSIASKARDARTDLYLEARDEALFLHKRGFMTHAECRMVLAALYKARYLKIVKPPVNYVSNLNIHGV
jgi:hypothetical protein